MDHIEHTEGRRLFGLDAVQYDQARPPYPDPVYSLLVSHGALFPGATTLEIGPGSGTATRRLIEAGANPITLVEPDARFSDALQELGAKSAVDLRVRVCAFEDAALDRDSFDLIVAATVFHWLDPECRVNKIADAVRPGGHVALVWNLFQDATRPDEFHDATRHLLEHLAASPSVGASALPFALDRASREAEFCRGGDFELTAYSEVHWAVELDTSQLRSLYRTFSSIAALPEPERERLLEEVCDIAVAKFGGIVRRNMTTPMYLFRRPETS